MSAITYVLNQGTLDGHVYLEKNMLVERTQELLGISIEQIDREIMELQLKQQIKVQEDEKMTRIYLSQYYLMEEACAHKICQCLAHEIQRIDKVEKRIASIEMRNNISLDGVQKEAVLDSAKYPFLYSQEGREQERQQRLTL